MVGFGVAELLTWIGAVLTGIIALATLVFPKPSFKIKVWTAVLILLSILVTIGGFTCSRIDDLNEKERIAATDADRHERLLNDLDLARDSINSTLAYTTDVLRKADSLQKSIMDVNTKEEEQLNKQKELSKKSSDVLAWQRFSDSANWFKEWQILEHSFSRIINIEYKIMRYSPEITIDTNLTIRNMEEWMHSTMEILGGEMANRHLVHNKYIFPSWKHFFDELSLNYGTQVGYQPKPYLEAWIKLIGQFYTFHSRVGAYVFFTGAFVYPPSDTTLLQRQELQLLLTPPGELLQPKKGVKIYHPYIDFEWKQR